MSLGDPWSKLPNKYMPAKYSLQLTIVKWEFQVIILKNQYNGKIGEDIWSSLILSLPAEEIFKMAPKDQIDSKEEEAVDGRGEEEASDEDEREVVTIRLEDAGSSSKKGRMSKAMTVKDLKQEYDKFARWIFWG